MDALGSDRLPGTMMAALRRRETYFGAAREISSLLQCAGRYPGGMLPARRRRSPGTRAEFAPASGGHRTPVVLIHGLAHNHSGWWVIRRHLEQAGFEVIE